MLATHPIRNRTLVDAQGVSCRYLTSEKIDEALVSRLHCPSSYADSHRVGYENSPLQGYESAHNNDGMELKDRIKAARAAAKLSQVQTAEKSGVDQTTISKLERGKHAGSGHIVKIARALGVDAHWLATGEGSMMPAAQDQRASYQVESNVGPGPRLRGYAPEIGWAKAGSWTEVCHVENDPEATPWHPRLAGGDHTFVLRIEGDSMLPDYPPGRLIFVDPERSPENGDDVIAVLTDTDEATFKRYIEEPGSGRLLKALNPDWPQPYIAINGNCRIIGVVVADMRLR